MKLGAMLNCSFMNLLPVQFILVKLRSFLTAARGAQAAISKQIRNNFIAFPDRITSHVVPTEHAVFDGEKDCQARFSSALARFGGSWKTKAMDQGPFRLSSA
jgi:hypothetical protein